MSPVKEKRALGRVFFRGMPPARQCPNFGLPFEMRSLLDAFHLTDTSVLRRSFMRRRASNRGFSRTARYIHPKNAPYIQRGGIRL